MKNIIAICNTLGIEIPQDKIEEFTSLVNENYKTVSEFEKKIAKLEDERDSIKTQLETTENALKKFDGVDTEELNRQIRDLTEANEKTKAEYEKKIADREFDDRLKEAISQAKGKDVKSIMAHLEIETLRESHNQDADIASAINAIKTERDYLFDAPTENKAQFTAGLNPAGKDATTSLRDLKLDERIALKASNPELYQSLKGVNNNG